MTTAEVLTASVRIAAAPEAVFPYLVDAALIVEWIGDWAELDPQPGGVFALDISTTPVRGQFLEVDPPNRVVFTWGVPGRDGLPPGSTTVEIVLTKDGDETLVELFHRGLPPDEFGSHRAGWTEKLGCLVTASAATR